MYRIRGTGSTEIDGCEGLIRQFSRRAYRGIGPGHQRWMEEEDLAQEAVILALYALKEWTPEGGAKFSTYLFQALMWGMWAIRSGLYKEKRNGVVVELDAPVAVESETVTGADRLAGPEDSLLPDEENCVRSFVELCRAVSDPAKVVLIRGFLFSKSEDEPELCKEIGVQAARLHIGPSDLSCISEDVVRKKVLTAVAGSVTMGQEADGQRRLRLLECMECGGHFSLLDIRESRFYVQTMTCRACYIKLSKKEGSCFSRQFKAGAVECSIHCQDRAVCKEFTQRKEKQMVTAEAGKELEGVDLSGIGTVKAADGSKTEKAADSKPEPVAGKVDKPKAKTGVKAKVKKAAAVVKKAVKKVAKAAKTVVKKAAKKAAKKVAAEKKQELQEPDPPKGVTDWPWRRGSMMRYVFQVIYGQGISPERLKKLEKKVEETGVSWKTMKKCMAQQDNGKGSVMEPTHMWLIDESGGGLRAYNLKQVRESRRKKAKREPKAAVVKKAVKKTAKKAVKKAPKPVKVAKKAA